MFFIDDYHLKTKIMVRLTRLFIHYRFGDVYVTVRNIIIKGPKRRAIDYGFNIKIVKFSLAYHLSEINFMNIVLVSIQSRS